MNEMPSWAIFHLNFSPFKMHVIAKHKFCCVCFPSKSEAKINPSAFYANWLCRLLGHNC